MGCTLKQRDKITSAYLESPYLPPDSNICETAIRNFAFGRKPVVQQDPRRDGQLLRNALAH
ncbi:MAG: IS66 family transposase [Treponema sp.]|nr:IS66 family transposase [Treponema sp.]